MDDRTPEQVEILYLCKMVEDGFDGVNKRLDCINGRVRDNEKEVAGIKGRASTAGVVSGAISGVSAALATYFGLGAS